MLAREALLLSPFEAPVVVGVETASRGALIDTFEVARLSIAPVDTAVDTLVGVICNVVVIVAVLSEIALFLYSEPRTFRTLHADLTREEVSTASGANRAGSVAGIDTLMARATITDQPIGAGLLLPLEATILVAAHSIAAAIQALSSS